MKPLSDLVHAHRGRPALIMGGGASMPEQAARAPEASVQISVNQHGCLLRKCDYIVACDDKPGKRFAGPNGLVDLKSFGVPIISPRSSMADYRMFERPTPNNSGIIASWIAWLMGCCPILLAGMDCFAGGVTYWHTPNAQSSGRGLMVDRHVQKWRFLREKLPEAGIRLMGDGPLRELFKVYDRAEVLTPVWPDPAVIASQVAGKRVRVVKPWRKYPAGIELQVGTAELEEGKREGKLVLL